MMTMPGEQLKAVSTGLIISIDGTTQEVYQQYRRGGKLNKVIEGTKNIVAWKKKLKSRTPFIFFQFLVVKPNEHQVGEIKKLAKECGVDEVRFKTAQVYDYENDPNQLIPVTQKFSRYKKDKNGDYKLEKLTFKPLLAPVACNGDYMGWNGGALLL